MLKNLAFYGGLVLALLVGALAYGTFGNVNFLRAGLERQASDLLSRKTTLAGPVRLAWAPAGAGLSFSSVELANLPGGASPSLAEATSLTVIVPWGEAFSGLVGLVTRQPAPLRSFPFGSAPTTSMLMFAEGPVITFERRDDGVWNTLGLALTQEGGEPLLARLPEHLTVLSDDARLRLIDFTIPYETGLSAEGAVLTIEDGALRLTAARSTEWDFEAALSDFRQTSGAPLKARLTIDPLSDRPALISADGRLQHNQGFDLGLGFTTAPDSPVGLAGGLSLGRQSAEEPLTLTVQQLTLTGETGALSATGKLSVDEQIALEGSINGRGLPLEPLVNRLLGAEGTDDEGPARPSALADNEVLPFQVLDRLSGALDLSLTQTTLGALTLGDLDTRVTFGNRQARLRTGEIALGGPTGANQAADQSGSSATLAISLAAQNRDEASGFQLATTFTQIPGPALFEALGYPPFLTGLASGRLELEGQGRTRITLRQALEGTLQLAMADGRLSPGFLAALAPEIQGPEPGTQPLADLSCFLMDVAFEKGFGQPRALVLETGLLETDLSTEERLTVWGTGQINLRQGTVNLALGPRLADPVGTRLPVDHTLRGPLREPQLLADAQGLGIGLRTMEGRVPFEAYGPPPFDLFANDPSGQARCTQALGRVFRPRG